MTYSTSLQVAAASCESALKLTTDTYKSNQVNKLMTLFHILLFCDILYNMGEKSSTRICAFF